MPKRGRKPPKHTPLICTGCGRSPIVRDNALQPCVCGADWNLPLLDEARRPDWLQWIN